LTLTPAIERYGASGHVNYTLTDYANAFVHTTYRNSKTHYQEAPQPADGYNNREVIVGGVAKPSWGILPKENAFNPLYEDVSYDHRLLEVGPRLIDIESEVFRILPGLKFNIGDSWQAETAILYNSVESVLFGRNYISADALKDALASSDPATAYNIFGDGYEINRPDVLDGLRANILRRAQFELQMWDVKAAGDLYELPGGTLAMAVGAETAKEESRDIGDSLSMANKIVGYSGTSNVGSRSRDAGYAEFMIPLIGEDNRIAGIHSLGLQAAWRFEKYSDFGSTDNPKVGLKYSPEEHVLLRATYQTAFRAPSLQQLYMGQSVSYPFLFDPARRDGGMQYRTIDAGNEDLDPEESDSFSVGGVFDIPMPDDMSLSVSVNWSQIELEDQITSLDPRYMLNNEERFANNIIRNPQTGADKADGIPGSIKHINSSYLNLAEVEIEALDLQLDYGIGTSVGYFSANLAATYLYQYDFKARPTDEFRELSGHYNRPEWRGRARIWWTYDKYSAGATINYVDSFAQYYRFVPEYTEVDEHTTLDLQASYDLTGNSRITVGALNVTDEDPPWSNSYEGYAVATAGHSPLGTVLYGRVTIRF
jgi:outer membrane receptor protein involved in Fe transport